MGPVSSSQMPETWTLRVSNRRSCRAVKQRHGLQKPPCANTQMPKESARCPMLWLSQITFCKRDGDISKYPAEVHALWLQSRSTTVCVSATGCHDSSCNLFPTWEHQPAKLSFINSLRPLPSLQQALSTSSWKASLRTQQPPPCRAVVEVVFAT